MKQLILTILFFVLVNRECMGFGFGGGGGWRPPSGGLDGQILSWSAATGRVVWTTGTGTGDMLASTFDTDSNGAVDVNNGGTNLTAMSANVLSLLGAADYSAMRTLMGLVIGTNVLAPNGSAASLTSFPTLNQNTTGTAGGLTGTPNITVGTIAAGASGFIVDADGDTTTKSITVVKVSGSAGDMGLYEANSTDTHAAGFRGPASITGDGAYRGQFPNARPSSANMVQAWTNVGETGTGTASDPYVQATSYIDLDDYVLKATYQTKCTTINAATASSDFLVERFPYAVTIRAAHVMQLGATNVIGHFDECDGNGANPAGVDGATDITATTTNANDDGALSNASIDSGDYIQWHTTSVSGTNTQLTVCFDYTVD